MIVSVPDHCLSFYSVLTVNKLHFRRHKFVIEDHMIGWHSFQICYPLEIKVLL